MWGKHKSGDKCQRIDKVFWSDQPYLYEWIKCPTFWTLSLSSSSGIRVMSDTSVSLLLNSDFGLSRISNCITLLFFFVANPQTRIPGLVRAVWIWSVNDCVKHDVNPWWQGQKQLLKRWKFTWHWHSWAHNKSSLHSVTMKTLHYIYCHRIFQIFKFYLIKITRY